MRKSGITIKPSYYWPYLSRRVLRPVYGISYMTKYRHLAPADKVIYININRIGGWHRKYLKSGLTFQGIIKRGNWDLNVKKWPLEKRSKYIGIYERFKLGYNWQDTTLFKRYKKKFTGGRVFKGCSSVKELEKHYVEKYDALYEKIKSRGILNPKEDNVAPLYIKLGRNGEIFWTSDGNHRLSMCHILGIESIPVYVWMRHRLWQEKRERILSGELTEFRNHPDIISETGS